MAVRYAKLHTSSAMSRDDVSLHPDLLTLRSHLRSLWAAEGLSAAKCISELTGICLHVGLFRYSAWLNEHNDLVGVGYYRDRIGRI